MMKVKCCQKSATEPQVINDNILIKELDSRKAQLKSLKNSVKSLKNEINLCIKTLRKEIGDDVDLQAMVKSGYGPGNYSRKQELMILKLRLTAMKSKFLDPSHKLYYRGPFDPKKKFDLKCLPQKQDTLYDQILEEDKMVYLKKYKSKDELIDQIKDLHLMYKASILRTASLDGKIKAAKSELEILKSKALVNSRMIEFIINHQNLMKLMLNPETLDLEPEFKTASSQQYSEEVSDLYKFKTLYEGVKKEVDIFCDKFASLTEALDKSIQNLLEGYGISNQYKFKDGATEDLENEKSEKVKPAKNQTFNEDALMGSQILNLVKENKRLKDFLTSSAFSNSEDFNIFVVTLNNITNAFLNDFETLGKEMQN